MINLPSGAAKQAGVFIDQPSPGLFTQNEDLLAAAEVLRVKADGTESSETVSEPISLGDPSDQVFLVLYGTGIRGGSGVEGMTARIGNVVAAVTYAGAVEGAPGRDQVKIRVPRALNGRGKVDVELQVNGRTANTVRVTFR
jgi:uncharacterized protein (TIGR03437 family)